MWEYSISLLKRNEQLADLIYSSLREELGSFHAIIARSDEGNFSHIVIAVKDEFKKEGQGRILKVITLAICGQFKLEFLSKRLRMPTQDELSQTAFIQALINFDKETDYYLIAKNLDFNEFLFLESFYDFKLKALRSKWGELISLANENRDYLISSDAFFDLVKFLIDNLDIGKDEIDVVEEESGYYIYDGIYHSSLMAAKDMVGRLIDLSPQKINFYYKSQNHATEVLKAIFDRRVNLLSREGKIENFETNPYF